MVRAGAIVVVRADDEYSSYYLIKVVTPSFTLAEDCKDDYGHIFFQNTEVISGHYFEIYGNRDDLKYFLDSTNTCFLSTFCIVGICPELDIVPGKRKSKVIDVYCVSAGKNETLMKLCTSLVI